jgi:hypothetical protein
MNRKTKDKIAIDNALLELYALGLVELNNAGGERVKITHKGFDAACAIFKALPLKDHLLIMLSTPYLYTLDDQENME